MSATYSVKEASAILGISGDTIRRKVRKGELQSSRDQLGRLQVILEEDHFDRELLGRSTNAAYTASAVDVTVRELQMQIELQQQLINTLKEELNTRRSEAASFAEERAEFLRVLHQQQTLHAQASGIKLIPQDSSEALQPRRRWWRK